LINLLDDKTISKKLSTILLGMWDEHATIILKIQSLEGGGFDEFIIG
jgi:hypothetical protein